ncbi:polysaccharide deacetylase family sporulation protein PdaB [Neobacillus ginsengisoli]|uniref:Polysaccharide deacetylase family sporulation protein PdaB n=1 Tax=Neobacillus ginsengisoli TaxID=904295 RepID=A0ABT9XZN6_9BACI|nr:polysaccharide deacetylase family protein [Neobacillus ginsengisoli]MDQ0201040.1 polysaccharide deacetylase family sporulation protein PdaB [Neobacillus ginsengisoli]
MKRICLLIILICSCFITHTNASTDMIRRKEVEPTGQVVWEVHTSKKIIALTFDDGPNPKYTPQVLELLKQYDAHATFFQIGFRMERYPQIVQQVVQAGHELGNHSMTHQYENKAGVKSMGIEMIMADRIIQKYLPNHLKLFRPPGGYIDTSLLHEAKQLGYKVVLWSYHQDTKDWSLPGTQVIANHIIRHARSGDIVLLHDGGGDRSQTIQALKSILPTLKQQGYQFVSVSELLHLLDFFAAWMTKGCYSYIFSSIITAKIYSGLFN